MKSKVYAALRWSGIKLWRYGVSTLPAARRGWLVRKREPLWPVYLGLSLLLFKPLTLQAFELGFLTGVDFIYAGATAIYYGYILRHPGAIVIVYIGVILGGEVTHLLLPAFTSARNGDYISGIVLLGFGGYIWIQAQRFQKVDDDWEPWIVSRVRKWNNHE